MKFRLTLTIPLQILVAEAEVLLIQVEVLLIQAEALLIQVEVLLIQAEALLIQVEALLGDIFLPLISLQPIRVMISPVVVRYKSPVLT